MGGRLVSGFKDWFSIASTEDFEISCDPCKCLGKTIEAKGFCVNCQENICKHCLDCHTSTKASHNHHLLDQPQKVIEGTYATSDDSTTFTEYCNIHTKELIMFFCSRHDQVGCSDCMAKGHKTCNIDYIPDVCSGILESKEFSGTLQNVLKRLNEFESIKENAHSKKTEIKTFVEGVIKEIETFQKKMNDRIEQLKQQLVDEATSHKSHQDQEVDKLSDSCDRVYLELQQIQKDLTDCLLTDCRSDQLEAQAFVTMKQAQRTLSSINIQAYEQDLTDVLTTNLFEQNGQLENVLSEKYGLGRIAWPLANIVKKDKPEVGLGKLSDADVNITQERTSVVQCIQVQKTINVKTDSDTYDCFIAGCAVISADKLLLADRDNRKLKIMNTDTHTVVEEMNLDSFPWDVTVLPRNQVAVTLPGKQKILILETTGKLTKIRNMNVRRQGLGIAYHQNYLYVVCQKPNCLLVLDMRGNMHRDIPLKTAQDKTFSGPLYIAVGKDGHTLYISDWKSQFVASLTLQGNVTGVYKHNELSEPNGLEVLEDGSLIVCCYSSGTIHYISADLKQGRTLIRDVCKVQSICCYAGNRQIYVGALYKDFNIFDYE